MLCKTQEQRRAETLTTKSHQVPLMYDFQFHNECFKVALITIRFEYESDICH